MVRSILYSSLLLIFFLKLLSCSDQPVAERNDTTSALKDDAKEIRPDAGSLPARTFIDSVQREMELSFEQIEKYTTLYFDPDTNRYPNQQFVGDTVLHLSNGGRAAVIAYSDGVVCARKYLLIYLPDSSRNCSALEIETICDRDLSAVYRWTGYRLINDSTIELTDHFSPAETEEELIAGKTTYVITGKGTLDIRGLQCFNSNSGACEITLVQVYEGHTNDSPLVMLRFPPGLFPKTSDKLCYQNQCWEISAVVTDVAAIAADTFAQAQRFSRIFDCMVRPVSDKAKLKLTGGMELMLERHL